LGAVTTYDTGLSLELDPHAEVSTEPFEQYHIVCVIFKGHPLEEKKVIHPADLHGEEVIDAGMYDVSRRELDKILNSF